MNPKSTDIKKGHITAKGGIIKLKPNQLLFIAFLEGAMVLGVEILGAKTLSPFFGNSFIVWTSVIAITLTFLTLGYFAGGWFSRNYLPSKVLFYMLLAASLIMVYMPFYVYPIMKTFQNSDIYAGSIFSAILLLGPCLFCLGSTSPLIIQSLTQEVAESGKYAGTVYAISTLGGILMNFMLGFWIITEFGITAPLVLLAIILFISVIVLFYEKNKLIYFVIVGILILLQSPRLFKPKPEKNKEMSIPYISEGLLGQLKVVDIRDQPSGHPLRLLLINGIGQTRIVNNPSGVSFWKYVHRISVFSSLKKDADSALLMGFGAGSVANELNRLGLKVDAVEIDPRMMDIAKEHFYFHDSTTRFIVDDARHYLMTNRKKYELIIFDLLSGEVQPSYVFTDEGINKLKSSLTDNAMVLINFQELIVDKKIFVYKSIIKTFEKCGFNVYFSSELTPGGLCDVLMIASIKEVDFSKLKKENLTICCAGQPWLEPLLQKPVDKLSTDDKQYVLFTDDIPSLDHLNITSSKTWRESMLNYISKPELNSGLKIFQ